LRLSIVVLLFALVALNGLFVAAEFALVRTRKGRIEALAAEGEMGAEQALEQGQVGILGLTEHAAAVGEPGELAVEEPRLRRLGRDRQLTGVSRSNRLLEPDRLRVTALHLAHDSRGVTVTPLWRIGRWSAYAP